MEINKINLKKHIELYLIGDTHFPRGKLEKFKTVIDEIKNNPDALVIGLGDWIEGIIPGDPRYNPEESNQMLDEQWEIFEKHIEPIKNKIIGLHSGNHGGNVIKRYSMNELRKICKRISCRYLGDGTSLFELCYDDKTILLQTSHGIGGGTSAGHAYNKLDYASRNFADMDIVANGHTHKLGVNVSIAPLELVDGMLKQKVQYHCSCGSFLTNYELGVASYGERKGYAPLPLGYIKVIINDGIITHVIPVPV